MNGSRLELPPVAMAGPAAGCWLGDSNCWVASGGLLARTGGQRPWLGLLAGYQTVRRQRLAQDDSAGKRWRRLGLL